VTLLDRAACHVFRPLLYQCATGTLSIGQISRSLREELAHHRNVTTLLGEVIELDADARRVTAPVPDSPIRRRCRKPRNTASRQVRLRAKNCAELSRS
jgi:NADH:ubiquinone reductase (H+-translocating)